MDPSLDPQSSDYVPYDGFAGDATTPQINTTPEGISVDAGGVPLAGGTPQNGDQWNTTPAITPQDINQFIRTGLVGYAAVAGLQNWQTQQGINQRVQLARAGLAPAPYSGFGGFSLGGSSSTVLILGMVGITALVLLLRHR